MKFRLNFSPRYALFEARKAAQSQDRAYYKDGGALLHSLTKPASFLMTL